MILWRARTTSVCVSSLKSGLHMVGWRFQFWFSLPRWFYDLCTNNEEFCGNISSSMPVSFFQCLLLSSMFYVHTKIYMDMFRECINLILELTVMFLTFQMTFSLVAAAVVWAILESTLGLDPSSDSIAPRYLKLWTFSSFYIVIYGNVSTDAIGVVCHQLGLLCTDLHAICHGSLYKVIYQLDQLLLLFS